MSMEQRTGELKVRVCVICFAWFLNTSSCSSMPLFCSIEAVRGKWSDIRLMITIFGMAGASFVGSGVGLGGAKDGESAYAGV